MIYQQVQNSNLDDEDQQIIGDFKRFTISGERVENPPGTQKKIKYSQVDISSSSAPELPMETSSVIANRILMYSITMQSMGSAIVKKTVRRYITRKAPFTITLYKCKLEALSVYNYAFAVYLVNIINIEFPFTLAQIVPLQQVNQKGYQIVYRFDLYDPMSKNQSKILPKPKQLDSNIGETDISEEYPLLELLQTQYEGISFDAFKSEFQDAKKNNKKVNKSPGEFFQKSLQNCRGQMNKMEGKFDLKVYEDEVKFSELISIFELNIIINMFIRSYHMEHSYEFRAVDFRRYIKKMLEKYPKANYE